MKRIIGIIWVIVFCLMLLPIPLSSLDPVFHWLLLITIPFGSVLLFVIGILWLLTKSKPKNAVVKGAKKKEITDDVLDSI